MPPDRVARNPTHQLPDTASHDKLGEWSDEVSRHRTAASRTVIGSVMMDRNNPFSWTLHVVSIAGVDFRVHWSLPALFIVYCLTLGPTLGLAFSGVVVLVLLLHEVGHVIAARATGGTADEVQLAFFGGLAPAQPGPGHLAQFLTAGAGPLVNVLICILTYPGLYAPEMVRPILTFHFPVTELHPEALAVELLALTFIASWFLLLINLLPVHPLDGGQMTFAALASLYPPEIVHRGMVYFSFGAAVLLMLTGVVVQWSGLVLLGAIVLAVNLVQAIQLSQGESTEDSFMGYDFSQGYTSLERSAGEDTDREPRKSTWQQWKSKREEQKEQEARERRLQDEMKLDELLAKVHEQGYQSLTAAEKRVLERVSTEYRERSKKQSSES